MKIKFNSLFMGCTFNEIHPRKFEPGKIYEVGKDIDDSLCGVVTAYDIASVVDEEPEPPKKSGWFKNGENKVLKPEDNKMTGNDIVSTLRVADKPIKAKRTRKKKE